VSAKPPAALAGYLVDRYLGEGWHPMHGDADLYVIALGESVAEAIVSEIDGRLVDTERASEAGTVAALSERGALELLKANLQAARAAGD